MEHHSLFNVLTMNIIVPIKKIVKKVYTHRNPKHERRTSLQECFDSATGTRRRSRCNSWVILLCLLSLVLYLYSHRAHYLPGMRSFNNENNDVMPYKHFKPTQLVTYLKNVDSLNRMPSTSNTEDSTAKSTTKPTEGFYRTANSLLLTKTEIHTEPTRELPLCLRKKPYPKFEVKMKSVNLTQENVFPMVGKGGSYHPRDCKPRFKVAIIVPYRDRERNLGTFLYNIHPFLMRQKLDYQIFVIEQDGKALFNKGRVYNAGYKETLKFNAFHCVVFHDLDLLPLHENIVYNCPTLPRHMCARVNDTAMKKFDPTYKFQNLFGGVVSMTKEQFERANGFSNLYFGWGGEDNDMFWRLRAAGYPIVRYNITVGVYLVLPHKRESPNPYRFHLLSRAVERYKTDGLSNIEYYVMSTKFLPLCTHIIVDINPRSDNITQINHKWGVTRYKIY